MSYYEFLEYLLFYIVHVLKMIVEIASFLFLRERNVVSLKVSLITGGDFHMKWIQMPLGHYKQMLIF